jgi:putative holliday junction resolvase
LIRGQINASANNTFAAVKRTLALDFGMKRCGLAISDPLGMIANGLDTEPTVTLMDRLRKLDRDQGFYKLVIGKPTRMNGEESSVEQNIKLFIESFQKVFPDKEIARMDERFTSKLAMNAMISAGAKKSQRKEKGNIDKVSATIILQEYLNK